MAGDALILIPGAACDAALWAPQVAALADVADVVVTEAHLAHDSLGAIAAAILAAAPPRFAVAGLSFGGHVVFELLRRAPEQIARAALLDTTARADSDQRRAARQRDIDQVGRGRFVGVSDRQLPHFVHPDHLAGLSKTVKNMTQRVGPDAFVRQAKAAMARPDSRPDLASINCPTLVLVGADDRVTPPPLAREIHAGIAGSTLVEVPRCGHLSTLEQPAAVNRALRDWLNL